MRDLTPGVSLADAIVLEVGYQVSCNFSQTAGMDRTEWYEYITERVDMADLIDAITEFLLTRWMVELDQAVVMECAFQRMLYDHDDLPVTRELFAHWCCETRQDRNSLIEIVSRPMNRKRLH